MKVFLQNLFVGVTALITMFTIALSYQSCKSKQGGTCTFEGLECPTAYNQFQTDSMVIAQIDSAHKVEFDSLHAYVHELQAKLAACELQEHSRIPVGTFTVVTVDTAIPSWQQYANFINHVVYE